MLHAPDSRRARRSNRKRLARRTAVLGVALGVVALTGITSATAAVAATQPVVAAAIGSAGETLSEISEQAESTLDDARAALRAAATVTDDIAASGLDVGVDKTTVDTIALRAAIDRLSALDVVPALLLPEVTQDAAAETRRVVAQTADLRERLDAAQAQKAAEEAAAAAQKAAEEAAAAAAAEAAAEAQRQAEAAAAALAAANTPEGAKVVAQQMASANYGWGADQFSCLVSLWDKESGWNYQAYNPSGATGIPQALPGSKMASAGSDWETNAVTQIAWGLGYISSVYGTPCSAWGHSQSTNWY